MRGGEVAGESDKESAGSGGLEGGIECRVYLS